ncbi:hypothetical protein A2954_00060 [Candidatus Roizmanbacteria bacterium RIFCSPLOWO2_01_FULL_37_12]|uniref:Antitoxin n=1 Tax=Candidatus Roizmanbacteria bacterium RIFCSPLOWO2_01_FULL_37_12 TaxID=1802056 RepID=A0A1F7IBE5_9BACT|nr:MAG: hypothetical protein A3D76_00385 [Candidatus Roizmanbacteria bacterium RIFCSPHIGHO2_02_FULL_37_9b]OGK40677.1 MAG: hypothetical protein A2954_00060 [Candidatus Roizmanbacteria bacterium RIFCSPLOWO2_01_FULL_37_12]
MFNSQNIKSLTDLRLDPAKITKLASVSDNPVYILNRGKPVSVILDVKVYEELIEKLNDSLDALEMKKFEKKPKKIKDWISHDKLVKKLKLS